MRMHTKLVDSFEALMHLPYEGMVNAIGWNRQLEGDFEALVSLIPQTDAITTVEIDELQQLNLSMAADQARALIISDMERLKALGADPVLNLIEAYEKDSYFFPTDVYSWHVDRSPIPTHTLLCTYYGPCSELLPNTDAIQKIQHPEIRKRLQEQYTGNAFEFESFLEDHYFDLHYQAICESNITTLQTGSLWRLAVDHPELGVAPCIHRAPREQPGEKRLLLIC